MEFRLQRGTPAVDFAALAVIAAAVALTGATGVAFQPGTWYEGLAKPAWTPPDIAFPVVWTLLYAAMIVSAWLIWRTRHDGVPVAMTLFGAQLALNAAWSPVFFGAHRLGAGFAIILALTVVLALMVRQFARVRPLAAWLMAPYLLWVLFAAALNLEVWRLNA